MTSPTLPFVSCICPTYGRYPKRGFLLEVAIESFLRQDYPENRRELIVINDCPGQLLQHQKPFAVGTGYHFSSGIRTRIDERGIHWRRQVGLLYCPRRIGTLGAKYNAAIEQSRGELICCWEDDDISLPWRVSLSVKMLGDADYFNPKAYWYLTEGVFQHEQMTGYAHNASIFRRSAWEKVGCYPDHCRQDAAMDSLLRERRFGLQVIDGPLVANESFYIYRWGESDHHVSAFGDPDQAYLDHGKKPVETGVFEIKPHWRQDYEGLIRSFL
jgi:glycosyltransferase involved in cell wall biosynthesis